MTRTPQWFWDQTRTALRGATGCETAAARLETHLRALPASDILAYAEQFDLRRAEAYRWDLWAVAYIAMGGASDDAFDYFRAWLILQGESRFNRALKDPRVAVEGVTPGADLECEDLLYAAAMAYEAKAGATLPRTVPHPREPAGTPWSEDDVAKLYPDLATRFGF